MVAKKLEISNKSKELSERFKKASDFQIDELDFFEELLEAGFSLEDIKESLPDKYKYSKNFMEEHGLM